MAILPEGTEIVVGTDQASDAADAVSAVSGEVAPEDLEEQLRKFWERYPMDARASEYLDQCQPDVKLKVITTFDPRNKDETDYSRQVTGYIRSVLEMTRKRGREEDGLDETEKRRKEDVLPPSEEQLMAFRARYPMDERAFEYFSSSSASALTRVLSEFRPREEGEADYSSLVTSFVKRMRSEGAQPASSPYGSRGPQGPTVELLNEFRRQFPMDERAWDFLLNASGQTQEVVISDFRPKRGDDDDYSAPVTAFVRSVRSGDRGRRGGEPAPSLAQLELFRERFPMDDRAFDYLCTSSAEMQREALQNFMPKRLEETDFSRQLTAFLRRGPVGPSQSHGGGGGYQQSYGGGGGYQDEGKGRPWRERSWKDVPDIRDVRNARGSVANGGSTGHRLRSFRSRYPMDDRAFDFLEQAGPEVQEVVLTEFRPRSEGDSDYSGAITSYVKAVKGRVGVSNSGYGAAHHGNSRRGDHAMDSFRRRYPMDDRAYEFLTSCSPQLQATVIERFRPKREGESDYSGLITSFIRACKN